MAECTIVLLIVHTSLPLIMKLDFDHEIVGKKNEQTHSLQSQDEEISTPKKTGNEQKLRTFENNSQP